MKTDISTKDIEIAVVSCIFPPRQFMVIPNASWGMQLQFEADLLVITKANWAYEVEIKTSLSDARADQKKSKSKIEYVDGLYKRIEKTKHEDGKPQNKYIKGFYYAFPECLYEKILPILPAYAGIIVVSRYPNNYCYAHFKRSATFQKVEKYPVNKLIQAGRLMQIRYWEILKREREDKK